MASHDGVPLRVSSSASPSPSRTAESPSKADSTSSSHTAEDEVQTDESGDFTSLSNTKTSRSDDSSKRARARNLVNKAKQKTKDILNIGDNPPDDEEENEMASDVAFNPTKVIDETPPDLQEKAKKSAKANLQALGETVAHPQRVMRDKATATAAGKISTPQRPFMSLEQDRDLLDAHDKLAKILSSKSTSSRFKSDAATVIPTKEEEAEARKKLKELEDDRAAMRVAWSIGKHVDRVRIVEYRVSKRPQLSEFIEKDESGEVKQIDWPKWVGLSALYYTRGFTSRYIDGFDEPPFDFEDLSRISERLVTVSAPWQVWFMSVREVYLWEDPKITLMWLSLFEILWYLDHVMGTLLAYIICATIWNRFHPTAFETMRKANERGKNTGKKALAIGELIERHGREEWIEPVITALGPQAQLMLGDFTSFLEVLTNFYRWEAPASTAATLFLFFLCIVFTLVTDWNDCMRILIFSGGNLFFAAWPIATRYPKYRRLVDPFRWLFWGIPDNAESSILHLQEKARVHQREIDEKIEKEGGAKESFVFVVYQKKTSGKFTIDREGLCFQADGEEWKIPYSRLLEMRKANAKTSSKGMGQGPEREGLEILYRDEEGAQQMQLFTVPREKREEIFSLILGWSDMRWRVLHLQRPDKSDEGSSHLDALRRTIQ